MTGKLREVKTERQPSGVEAGFNVSIVIPCYRDEASVARLFDELAPVMDQLAPAELVLVDDGSPDATTEQALKHATSFPHPVTVVRLARNFGQHPAVFAGLAHATGRIVVTADSDLQYPADQIPLLVAALDDEHPVASGWRQERRDPWLRKRLTIVMSRWLARRAGQDLQDFGSMFRAYDRRVVDAMLQITEQRRFIPALAPWLGFRVREVPVRHESRGARGSRYRMSGLVEMFLDLVTSYSVSPLRFISIVAIAGSAAGFVAMLGFMIYRLVIGAGVAGVVSAFALIYFLLGVQLAVLALVSEYVGRIYVETKGRPYYVVGRVERRNQRDQGATPR